MNSFTTLCYIDVNALAILFETDQKVFKINKWTIKYLFLRFKFN